MAYTTGDTILDDHYNGFATSVNNVWGTGTGDYGYGQTSTVATVTTSTTIGATQWTTLLARITSAANHQGSSITAISNPSAGSTISVLSALSGNITTITNNRLNVHARQSRVSTSCSTTTNLTGTINQTGSISSSVSNGIRYMMNAGGRLSWNWNFSGHTVGGLPAATYHKSIAWDDLAAACGTFYLYAQSSGKSGGSGTATTNLTGSGYHDLTNGGTVFFKQFVSSSNYSGIYTASYIELTIYNPLGQGNVTFSSKWVDAAADQTSFAKSVYNVLDTVDGTKATQFGYELPSTSYISASWGTVSNTVTGNG